MFSFVFLVAYGTAVTDSVRYAGSGKGNVILKQCQHDHSVLCEKKSQCVIGGHPVIMSAGGIYQRYQLQGFPTTTFSLDLFDNHAIVPSDFTDQS